MTDTATMKPQGKATIDQEAARLKGEQAAGAALAVQVVKYATEEAKADEKRGASRMRFVHSIMELSPGGHRIFRAELSNELALLKEVEAASNRKDSQTAGYSAASYKVMISCMRTISVACEAGLKIKGENWESVLDEARAFKSAAVANGTAPTGKDAGNKPGAGRKAASPVDKTMAAIGKLDRRQQRAILDRLAASFSVTLQWPAKPAKAAPAQVPAVMMSEKLASAIE